MASVRHSQLFLRRRELVGCGSNELLPLSLAEREMDVAVKKIFDSDGSATEKVGASTDHVHASEDGIAVPEPDEKTSQVSLCSLPPYSDFYRTFDLCGLNGTQFCLSRGFWTCLQGWPRCCCFWLFASPLCRIRADVCPELATSRGAVAAMQVHGSIPQ